MHPLAPNQLKDWNVPPPFDSCHSALPTWMYCLIRPGAPASCSSLQNLVQIPSHPFKASSLPFIISSAFFCIARAAMASLRSLAVLAALLLLCAHGEAADVSGMLSPDPHFRGALLHTQLHCEGKDARCRPWPAAGGAGLLTGRGEEVSCPMRGVRGGCA